MPAVLRATYAPYGAARSIGDLSMLPLLGQNGSPPDHLTLDEALRPEVAHVRDLGPAPLGHAQAGSRDLLHKNGTLHVAVDRVSNHWQRIEGTVSLHPAKLQHLTVKS